MARINFSEVRPVQRLMAAERSVKKEDGKWVCILARGECRSGGYDIELIDVFLENGVLTLVYEEYDPAPGSFVTMAITYPTRKYTLDLVEDPEQVVFQCG